MSTVGTVAELRSAKAKPRRYAMLRVHMFLLTLAGWGAVVAGILYAATLIQGSARALVIDTAAVAGLIVGGICLAAFAEFLQLAIDVEENTRPDLQT